MELKKNIYLILTFVLALALSILTYNIYEYPLWDSTAYLSNTNYFLTGHGYFESLRAPVFPLILAGFVSLGLQNIVPALFIILFLVSIYFLGKELFNAKAGFIAALLTAATPIFLLWSPRLLTDIPAATLTVVAFIFANRAVKNSKNLYIFGVLSSLAFLTRYTAGIVFVIGLLYYFSRKKFVILTEKETYITFVLFTIPIAAWFLFNLKMFGDPLFSIKEGLIAVSASSPKLFYLSTFYEALGLLAITSVLGIIASVKNIRKNKELVLLYFWILIGYAGLSIITHKEARYVIFLIPALHLLAANALLKKSSVAIFNKLKKILFLALIFLAIGSAYIGYHSILLSRTGDVCNENIIDAAKYISNTSGHVLSPYPPIISYYGSVIGEPFKTTKENLDNYVKEKNITYILISDSGDAPDWAKNYKYFMNKKYLILEKEFYGECQAIFIFKVLTELNNSTIKSQTI